MNSIEKSTDSNRISLLSPTDVLRHSPEAKLLDNTNTVERAREPERNPSQPSSGFYEKSLLLQRGSSDETRPMKNSRSAEAMLHRELREQLIEFHTHREESRRTQRELEESRDYYFELFHNAPVGYMTIDANARILEPNLRAAEMLGASVAELKDALFTRYIATEARDAFRSQLHRSFSGMKSTAFEVRLQPASGTSFVTWMTIKLVLRLKDAQRRTLVARVTLTDLGTNVGGNKHARRAHTRCAAEGHAPMSRAHQDPRPADVRQSTGPEGAEPLDATAALVAHDFNNLLTSILADVAMLELDDAIAEKQREYLEDVKRAAQRGAALTRRLLDASRKREVAASSERPGPGVPARLDDCSASVTLLLVDDATRIARSWSRLLGRLGYRVFNANGGAEALAMVREHGWEISPVILELVTPSMSGLDTLRQLRSTSPTANVLLWSGSFTEAQVAEILRHGRASRAPNHAGALELAEKIRSVTEVQA